MGVVQLLREGGLVLLCRRVGAEALLLWRGYLERVEALLDECGGRWRTGDLAGLAGRGFGGVGNGGSKKGVRSVGHVGDVGDRVGVAGVSGVCWAWLVV